MTVLILTPLPVEYQAVVKQLGGDRQTVYYDQAAYELGAFAGRRHTYQVILREPGMKNVDMALATERAIQRFKPQIALLIGIAGGVKDVRIGDLLIASKAYGYESGKEDADGFKARPAVESFSGELLARAQALSRSDDWKKRTAESDNDARVLIGPIAAGDKVVAGIDNPSFQRIKNHYNDTLGLEMEAIGFAAALQHHRDVHGLVIRGISDLCAGKAETDRQNWQPVAAGRAAAAAFELLYELDASNFIQPDMDAKTIAREVYELLFARPDAARELAEGFAQTPKKEIREIWQRVQPLIADEVEELAKDLTDTAAKGAAEMKLRKAVERDAGLGKTLETLLEKVHHNDGGGVNVVNSKNVVAGSTIHVGGDFRVGDEQHNLTVTTNGPVDRMSVNGTVNGDIHL